MAPAFLFIINTTAPGYKNGMVTVVCDAIRNLLAEERIPGEPRASIGLITYDSAIHFWALDRPEP
jgi:hypothetical protein